MYRRKEYSTLGFVFGLGLFILNFMDAFLTLLIVKIEGGYHVELNPLMRALMENSDWWWIPKLLIGFIVGLLIVTYWDRYYWFKVLSAILVSTYLVVVMTHILGIVGKNL